MQTHQFSFRFLVLIVMAMTMAGTLSSCAINPATGQGNLVLMTENREKEIGTEEHQKVADSMPFYTEPNLLAYVTEVGNRVASHSHRPDLEYQFFIIDSPEINAFALPGGYVYVNRGLLTFMNSEAQLAAVLGHEIGHITARHAVQQQARTGLANVASTVGGFVTAVATGSGFIGSQISQVTSIWAQSGLSGFGREHELEADTLGAEYLYNAGYDPKAVIDVITILKNQEDFNRLATGNSGGYHGLFATHPRNDTRLQQAVATVGTLATDQILEVDDNVFRQHLDGLIVGQSLSSRTTDLRNRYYQPLLGYTLVFPDEWNYSETTTTVTAGKEGEGAITVEAQRLQDNIEPRVFIRDKLGITNLQKSEALTQYRLIGHTGTVEDSQTGVTERIAVVYLGPRAFIFRGRIEASEDPEAIDQRLLASIKTFRAIQNS
ncbi:MAG: M48 family metalloprotease, partial [Pseudohongiellaceae bacterium]